MSQQTFSRIGVIGAGAWGTALANVAARAGADVVLWTRDPGHADEMARTCENQKRLPGVRLQDNVRPTADPRELARHAFVHGRRAGASGAQSCRCCPVGPQFRA